MIVHWRDTDFKTHEIDLSHAVDIEVNGIKINSNGDDGNDGIKVSASHEGIAVIPQYANCVIIKKHKSL